MSSDIEELIIEINNEHNGIVSVERMLEELLLRENTDESLLGSCVLCVSEAVCNIIDHGYSEGTSDIITVSMQLKSRKLIVKIIDHAQSMPQEVSQQLCSRSALLIDSSLPDLIDIPESGRGMGIISTFASDIEYDAQQDQNRLTLRFDL